MSTPKFADVHKLVAFQSKPNESEGFKQIIDFLNPNPSKYALMVNPTVYTSCIKQFWATAKAKNINGEAHIHAKVDGKKVIISKATIMRDIKFEDEGEVDCLSNEVIFEQLLLMGKPRRRDTQETQPSGPITNVADKALNVENVPTQSNDPPLSRVNTLGNREDRLKLNELMEICTNLQQRVIDLENTKSVQAQEISNLKKKVKRLEKKRRSRTHGLKRLYKIGLSARVESSSNEQSLGEDDTSKQRRNIADIDADAEITLVDETAEDQGRYNDQEMFDTSVLDDEEEVLLKNSQDVQNVVEKVIEDITTAGIEETISTTTLITIADVTPDELFMAQALVEIKKSKPKGASTTTTTITIPTPDSTRPKARGVVMQEPSETPTTTTIPIFSKVQDKGKCIMVEEPLKMKKKDQINFDEQEPRRLQAEIDEQDRLAEEKS
nr:hypothetical protein [Tanacetum cinerariifolium]